MVPSTRLFKSDLSHTCTLVVDFGDLITKIYQGPGSQPRRLWHCPDWPTWVQNERHVVGVSRQTRLGQPAAEKHGTASADLMREYGLPWKRLANPSPQLPASRRAAVPGPASKPTRKRRAAFLPVVADVDAASSSTQGPPVVEPWNLSRPGWGLICVNRSLVSAG